MDFTDDPLLSLASTFARWVSDVRARPPMLPADFPDYPSYCRDLFNQEERHKPTTDRLAATLLSSGSIPDTAAPWDRYFLALRIQSAAMFLSECSCTGSSDDRLCAILQCPRDLACDTLLRALWHEYRRDHWLKAVSVAAYFDLPLFGISPAVD